MDPESQEVKNWVCLYPAYINAKRTLAEGRRIPKEKAVEAPTSQEIYDILKSAGLNVRLEKNKMYPRDQLRDSTHQGRVRVQIKDENGALLKEEFNNRDSLMLYAAEMIPKLKSRQIKSATADTNTANQKTTQKKRKK